MDNKDEKQKTTYNIPGVIIPAQTTENGQVLESSMINTNKEINQNLTNTSNVSATSVAPMPNMTHVVNTNQTPSVPIEQQVIPPVGIINPPTSSSNIANQPTQLENSKSKKEKQKSPKSNKNNTLYILIIILLGGIAGYMTYQNYFTPKVEVDPVKEWQRKRTVNTNSLVVQELYNYVNLDGCDNQINFFYGESQNVKVTDLSDENRNYLAYRQLKYNELEQKNCSNYPNALHRNDQVALWYCGAGILTSGNNNFNDEMAITSVISEDSIKDQANKMFGEETYKAKTFAIGNSERYLYDSKLSAYIHQSFYGENSCKGYSNKLDKAYQEGDDLTIVVKVTNNENKSLQMFYYTFTESDDGNYYFKELNKRKI